MKNITLFATFLMAPLFSVAGEPYVAPDTSGEPLEVTRQLYIDLHEFKDDSKFHEVGFAPSV